MAKTSLGLSHPWRWFPEFLEISRRRLRSQARLLGLSLLVGIAAGVGAVVFYSACQAVVHFALDGIAGYRPHHPGGEPALLHETDQVFRPWLLVVVCVSGGLASGWLVFTFAPEAEGHGTDAAIASYHFKNGDIRPRVPLIKIIASALTIGTGGSGGREGPIAQIGAGVGSFLGRLLRLRPAERRILMAAGMGAGVAAIFRAPLAGALFAAEVMYRSPDFESDVIMPAGLASVTAYCTFGLFFGWTPLFLLPAEVQNALVFADPLQLFSYLLLAAFMAVLAMLYTRSFYWITHLFHELKIVPHLKPAVGALMATAVGLAFYFALDRNHAVLDVLSFGYGILQDAMITAPSDEGSLSLALVLLVVAVGKILTTGLTIGSGGSGGVFGPSMVIGGCAGGALGILLHRLWPALAPHPATFVIVGMAGFFAAAAKTPFSTLVMVGEMTGNYNLLLPALWVCVISFLLSDEQSIYSSQLESRSMSPAHQGHFVRELLAGLRVGQHYSPLDRVPVLRPGDRLADIARALTDSPYLAVPVLDAEGCAAGMATIDEVAFALQASSLRELVLADDLMQTRPPCLVAEDRLDEAAALLVEHNLPALPVVDDSDGRKVIGVLSRTDLSRAYLAVAQIGLGASAEAGGIIRSPSAGSASNHGKRT